MVHLDAAHKELFRRTADETFGSFEELQSHCQRQREAGCDRWKVPGDVSFTPTGGNLAAELTGEGTFQLNDWSFSQVCRLSGVAKDTVNRLSPETAQKVLSETLPGGRKPLQFLTSGETVRSLHGTSYTRLWNADVLEAIADFMGDFQPPQEGAGGGTGLYAGEQDFFAFFLDPTGWIEIEGDAFAPGFFIHNSEVGRRSLGIETFWFQSCCSNHIVWDAREVVRFTRKHTANVRDGLTEIRRIIETLMHKRDARRDQFAEVIANAAKTRLGDNADEVLKTLQKNGIPRSLGKKAAETAAEQGAFSIFAVVDALTRLSQQVRFAGDRTEADAKASKLLALAL